MLEVDFTLDAITVEEATGAGLVLLTTGYDPDKGDEAVNFVEPGDKRTPIPHGAAATSTLKTAAKVSWFIVRERTLAEPGTYEVKGSYRRGVERTFLLDVTETGLIVRAGSAQAYWIVGDSEPVRNDPKKDMIVYSQGGVTLIDPGA